MPISSPTPQSDIALEGELLSSLVHPNIIKLRGISYGAAAGFENGPRCVYCHRILSAPHSAQISS